MDVQKVGGVAVLASGPADGRAHPVPVVLLHGVPQDHRVYDHLAPVLEQAGRRVLRLDLPGLGASDPAPSYDVPALAARVVATLDEVLGEGTRFDLVGHDWGGVLAVGVASAAPGRVRRLVVANAPGEKVSLVRAPHLPLFALPGLPERLVDERFVRFLLTAGWKMPGRRHDRDLLDRWAKAYAEPEQLAAMLGYYRAAVRPKVRAAVRREELLPAPRISADSALVLWGADDPALPLFVGEALVKQLGRSLPPAEVRMAVVPGAGHFVLDEAPDEVAAVVLPFLSAAEVARDR